MRFFYFIYFMLQDVCRHLAASQPCMRVHAEMLRKKESETNREIGTDPVRQREREGERERERNRQTEAERGVDNCDQETFSS